MKKVIVIFFMAFSIGILFNSCMALHGSHSSYNNSTQAHYTCSMHTEVFSMQPGKCPKCGMNLELVAGSSNNSHSGTSHSSGCH